MAVFDAACHGVRIYSRVLDSCLYFFTDDMSGGGIGRLFRSSSVLLGPIIQFGIEETVRSSCYLAGSAKAIVHRTECIVWAGTPHPGSLSIKLW